MNKPQMICIKINPILLSKFDKVIKRKGLNRSEAIRALMVEYTEKNKDKT